MLRKFGATTPTSAATWPPASSLYPPLPASRRRSASAFPSARPRFLCAFLGALVSAVAPPTLLRSASIRSTTFSPRGRSFGVIGLPERLLLIRSISAVS